VGLLDRISPRLPLTRYGLPRTGDVLLWKQTPPIDPESPVLLAGLRNDFHWCPWYASWMLHGSFRPSLLSSAVGEELLQMQPLTRQGYRDHRIRRRRRFSSPHVNSSPSLMASLFASPILDLMHIPREKITTKTTRPAAVARMRRTPFVGDGIDSEAVSGETKAISATVANTHVMRRNGRRHIKHCEPQTDSSQVFCAAKGPGEGGSPTYT
jgi:hypothetical protein